MIADRSGNLIEIKAYRLPTSCLVPSSTELTIGQIWGFAMSFPEVGGWLGQSGSTGFASLVACRGDLDDPGRSAFGNRIRPHSLGGVQGRPSHTDDAESLGALVAHDPEALIVAVDRNVIVGSVIAAWDGWRGSIHRLVVAPSHRRESLASQLLHRAEAHLSEVGAVRLQAVRGHEKVPGYGHLRSPLVPTKVLADRAVTSRARPPECHQDRRLSEQELGLVRKARSHRA
jgi:GNAT superfamily N-acetyltransferase